MGDQIKFWLGIHMISKIPTVARPMFISAARLRIRRTFPRAGTPWILDSAGFSEISIHGRWTVDPVDYVRQVRLWSTEIGRMAHCVIQDWMCEPFMIAKTGLSVGRHQSLTVRSWEILNHISPDLPWVPVLQGYTLDEYHRCADLYERRGHNVTGLPLVGIGSICRRQGTKEAVKVISSLFDRGFKNLHGFGVKISGLSGKNSLSQYLASADSMAWSFRARKEYGDTKRRLCRTYHYGGCQNCEAWARDWHDAVTNMKCEESYAP